MHIVSKAPPCQGFGSSLYIAENGYGDDKQCAARIYTKSAENLDKINARLAAEGASKSRLDDYVAASHLYAEIVRAKGEEPDESLLSLPKTPEFSGYYKTSDEERMSEYGYVAAAAVVGGIVGWYYSASGKHKKA